MVLSAFYCYQFAYFQRKFHFRISFLSINLQRLNTFTCTYNSTQFNLSLTDFSMLRGHLWMYKALQRLSNWTSTQCDINWKQLTCCIVDWYLPTPSQHTRSWMDKSGKDHDHGSNYLFLKAGRLSIDCRKHHRKHFPSFRQWPWSSFFF